MTQTPINGATRHKWHYGQAILLLWLLFVLGQACQCNPPTDCSNCPASLCVNGLCQKTQCIPAPPACSVGEVRCIGDKSLETCVKSKQPCESGRWKVSRCDEGERCSNGQCQSTCKPQCTEGQFKCDPQANTVQSCTKGTDGCLAWGQTTPCTPGQQCDQGSCGKRCGSVPPPPCQTGERQCVGDTLRECVATSDGCSANWKDTPCTNDQRCDAQQSKCVDKPKEDPRKTILKDIEYIGIPGAAGSVTAFGKDAVVLVAGKANDRLYEPVVAINRWGKGRVAAMAHGGYLNEDIQKVEDTGAFMQKLIGWLAASDNPTSETIGVWGGLSIAKTLEAAGYKVVRSSDINTLIGQAKVILLRSKAIATPAARTALETFISKGGGALLADTAWGWAQLNPGKSLLTDFPGNLFLQKMGIAWTGSILGPSHPKGFALAQPTEPIKGLLLVPASLALLVQHAEGKAKPTDLSLDEATHITLQAIRHIRKDDKLLLPKLSDLVHQFPYVSPTPKQPLDRNKALARVLLAYQLIQSWQHTPDATKEHPAAANFPGSIPANAKRASFTLDIDTGIPDWHSTGAYAAPGEVVTIAIPASATQGRLSVRIGAHSDKLWKKEKWERVPEISRTWGLSQTTTKIASGFGGLIYIVVPKSSKLGTVQITIGNAVAAPRYIHGQTSLTDWQQTLRLHPAPWAELESKKVIFTLPSTVIRKLDDPDALMNHWDKVLDACADLATLPQKRLRPERVVTDQQISVGYMHAGYPIMTHLDVTNTFASTKDMTTKGGWGIYHEFGHNHQSRDWTPGGTVEVTVNLFTLYTFHTIHKNMQPRDNIYGAKRQAKIDLYFKGGARFANWKQDPFLALLMYMQLQEAFGWDTYKKVFAEYRGLTAQERPKNDNERWDQWMVRFSKATGKNLGPFMKAWGIPLSQKALDSVKTLPSWMPAGFPPKP